MTPDTVHYVAVMIRHMRGVLAAREKWIRSESFSREEALAALVYERKMLDAYYRSLGAVVVDT